jgi:hypothetical protein
VRRVKAKSPPKTAGGRDQGDAQLSLKILSRDILTLVHSNIKILINRFLKNL